MTEKERLYQQYEDAFFTLLMNEVAEDEGEALLQKNAQLLADDDAAVPDELHKRCLRTIEQSVQRARLQRTVKKTARVLSRAAMLLLIPVLLYGVAFAASETVRVKTLDFLVRELNVGTQYVFQNTDAPQTDPSALAEQLEQQMQAALPAEYELVCQNRSESAADYFFVNDAGEEVAVSVFFLAGRNTTITLDTEDAQTELSVIGDQSVTVIRKEGRYQLAWLNSEGQTMYAISGTSTAQQTIDQLAERMIRGDSSARS